MLGRLRTASSPLRIVMDWAPYSVRAFFLWAATVGQFSLGFACERFRLPRAGLHPVYRQPAPAPILERRFYASHTPVCGISRPSARPDACEGGSWRSDGSQATVVDALSTFYPYVSRGPRPATRRVPLRHDGAAGPVI